MSRRRKILIGIVVALLVILGLLWGGYKYGLKQCKPCPQPVVEVKKEAVKKPATKKAVKRQVVKQAPAVTKQVAPVARRVASVAVPSIGATKLILRINVVEWAPVFEGKSLHSRDIGPIVRQGLANGTVVRTKESLTFLVNSASVSVQDGSAIVDVDQITPETVLVVQPTNGNRFASPPGGLPLTTNPGELEAVVKRGVSEVWMNFILAPAVISPPEKKNLGGPRGLPPLPLFL